MTQRLFVAIDVPAPVRAALQPTLDALAPHGRAQHVEDLHLTLRFLGALDEARAAAVRASVAAFVRAVPRFRVELGGGGGFPELHAPRVLWAAAHAPGELLPRVAAGIDRAVTSIGLVGDDKGFVPHVTLCRALGPSPLGAAAVALVAALPHVATFEVDHIALMASRAEGAVPRYERVERWDLPAAG